MTPVIASPVIEGSYTLSDFAIDSDAEIQRLNAQVDLFWNQECALYQRLGLKDGISVLDCGCGPGYLLEKLRSMHPSLLCTGIEVDDQLYAVASQRGGSDPERWQIQRQSITAMDFPDNTFDFVVSRLVLEHLPDPMAALNEVWRVLKAGGKAVFIDNDFDLHERTWPESPSLAELYAAYRSARRSDGGNPCIGRQLPALLKTAGYASVDLHVLAAHSEVAGDMAFLRAEGSGIPAQLVKTGHLAASALDRIASEWRTMLATPHHSICRVLFAAVGEKNPSVSRNSHGARSEAESDVKTSGANSGVSPGTISSTQPASRDAVVEFIRQTLAAELGLAAENVAVDESLIRMGVDSMAAMTLCGGLESRFGTALSIADVLCDNSVNDLARKVTAGPR